MLYKVCARFQWRHARRLRQWYGGVRIADFAAVASQSPPGWPFFFSHTHSIAVDEVGAYLGAAANVSMRLTRVITRKRVEAR